MIQNVHFEGGFISSSIGNQDFFIADDDHITIQKTFLSLVDKGFIEIDEKNVTDDSYYYTYEMTDLARDLYFDLIFTYNMTIKKFDRDNDKLKETYEIAQKNIDYLIGDLEITSIDEYLAETIYELDKLRASGELNYEFWKKIDHMKESKTESEV